MVIQYKLKTARAWRDYLKKKKLKFVLSRYDFRLLSENRKKILVSRGTYEDIMKRFRQIEFFKRRKK